VWESFDVHVDQVIESADYLVAQLTNRAVLKATGKTVVFQNVWLFEVAGGRLVSAQLYADGRCPQQCGLTGFKRSAGPAGL
jgi:ketosteroid isomerase-like protein